MGANWGPLNVQTRRQNRKSSVRLSRSQSQTAPTRGHEWGGSLPPPCRCGDLSREAISPAGQLVTVDHMPALSSPIAQQCRVTRRQCERPAVHSTCNQSLSTEGALTKGNGEDEIIRFNQMITESWPLDQFRCKDPGVITFAMAWSAPSAIEAAPNRQGSIPHRQLRYHQHRPGRGPPRYSKKQMQPFDFRASFSFGILEDLYS